MSAPRRTTIQLLLLVVLATPGATACPEGYFATGTSLIDEGMTGSGDVVALDGRRIAIASGCPARRARRTTVSRGARYAARWPKGACTGASTVRLRLLVSRDCATLTGVLRRPGEPAIDFAATRSVPAPGDADLTFGQLGRTELGFDPLSSFGGDVAVLPDGDIVVGGGVHPDFTGNIDFTVARFTPNGGRNGSFGRRGVVTTDLGGSDLIRRILPAHGGKVLAVGESDGTFALVRYRRDGTLDRGFGTRGTARGPQVSNGTTSSATSTADGGILVVGSAQGCREPASYDCAVLMRFTANGRIDEDFGTGGAVRFLPSGAGFRGNAASFNDVAVDVTGRMLVVGTARPCPVGPPNSMSCGILARYDHTGSLDPTFGDDGFALVPTSVGFPNRVTVAGDGSVTVVGGLRQFYYSLPAHGIARFTVGGVLDPDFGTDGVIALPPFTDYAMLAPGFIAIAGSRDSEAATLLRFSEAWAADPNFGTGGVQSLSETFRPIAFALTPDGRLVVASADFAVRRYWP